MLISDAHDKLYRNTVKQIREDLGREVTLYLPGNKRKCANCLLDVVSQKSSGIYRPDSPYPTAEMPGPTPFTHGQCPVCKGAGFYATRLTEKKIKCHVRWLVPDDRKNVSSGVLLDADCRLQADVKFLKDFKRPPIKVKVDEFDMEVMKIYPRGLKGLAQLLVFLKLSDLNTPGNRNRTVHAGPL